MGFSIDVELQALEALTWNELRKLCTDENRVGLREIKWSKPARDTFAHAIIGMSKELGVPYEELRTATEKSIYYLEQYDELLALFDLGDTATLHIIFPRATWDWKRHSLLTQ